MFIIKQSDTFKWPVTIAVPADGGTYEKHTLTLKFKRLAQSEIQSLTVDGTEDATFVRAVVAGWEGVHDATKQPLDFTPAALDQLLDIPMAAATIVLTYMDAIRGELKRKN